MGYRSFDAALLAASRAVDAVAPIVQPTRVWVLSDLDIDDQIAALPSVLPDFDILVVAGNVSESIEGSLRWIAGVVANRRNYQSVVLVPGNREFRTGTIGDTLRRARRVADDLGITLLSDDATRIVDRQGRGVIIVGGTLWTDYRLDGPQLASAARAYGRHYSSDHKQVFRSGGRPFLPHDSAGAHARTRAFIEDVLLDTAVNQNGFKGSARAMLDCVTPDDAVVVVTHFPPLRECVTDTVMTRAVPLLRCLAASDLSEIMQSWGAPCLWIHGHVDQPVDLTEGKTRVLANPGNCASFDPALVVEVRG